MQVKCLYRLEKENVCVCVREREYYSTFQISQVY